MLPVPNAPTDPNIVVRRWSHHPQSVERARDDLRLHLVKWRVPGDVSEDAVLVLSELLTNSLRHAPDPEGRLIETRIERRKDGVRIEVHDASESKPELRYVSDDGESGRGLLLVDALTDGQWGAGPREGVGKVTWAEFGPAHGDGGVAQ
jgi:anti-sigma regulatory factor (Ser/Thr protein kinase)